MISRKTGISIQPFTETESEITNLDKVEEIHEVVIDSSIPKLIFNGNLLIS